MLSLSLGACAVAGGGTASAPGNDDDPGQVIGPDGRPMSRTELTAEVLRLRAERDRLARTNLVLEDELHWAHEDLRLAERQFSEFEHRLTEDFGKAAAVTAAAEARIHLDRTRNTLALPDSSAARVTSLIKTADTLIRNKNYLGALFFAERANHTLKGAERRAHLNLGETTRTIAVRSANVRQGPGQHFGVVGTLTEGARVSCLESADSWRRIVAADGSSGWIHASLLR